MVWNRSPDGSSPLRALGVPVAATPRPTCFSARAHRHSHAGQRSGDRRRLLERGAQGFPGMVAGHTVVNMGSTSPEYSRGLEAGVHGAGGRLRRGAGVRIPSTCRGRTTPGDAGRRRAKTWTRCARSHRADAAARPSCAVRFRPRCSCKLSVNIFMLTMVTGLAEACHFARSSWPGPPTVPRGGRRQPDGQQRVARQRRQACRRRLLRCRRRLPTRCRNNQLIAEAAERRRRWRLPMPNQVACPLRRDRRARARPRRHGVRHQGDRSADRCDPRGAARTKR